MPMRMRLAPVPGKVVRVPVVRVVNVLVRMFYRGVRMRVLVALGEMQPDTERHQGDGDPEELRRTFTKQSQRKRGTEKRRHREIGAGARAAQIAQRDDEEHQAHAVAQ